MNRKILMGIFIIIAALLLAGCGKKTGQETQPSKEPAAQPTLEPETVAGPSDTETIITDGVEEIGELDDELLNDDLDNIENDLEGINW